MYCLRLPSSPSYCDTIAWDHKNVSGPKIYLDQKKFWTQNFFGQNFFGTQNFFGQKLFGTTIFFDMIFLFIPSFSNKVFRDPKFLWTQNVTQNFFETQNYLGPEIFLEQKTLGTKYFLEPNV